MTEDDLDLVRSWRNHPDIRKFMYTQHEFNADEHRAWFSRASADERRHLFIYERDAVPSGFVGFTRLVPGSSVADWGFYVAPGAPSGTGRDLGGAALEYAFHELLLQKVNGQALAYNDPSIHFHERLGFKREGCLRQQHFDGNRYHDVVLFGLLSSEWRSGGEV